MAVLNAVNPVTSMWPRFTSVTVTSANSSATSATLLAANTNRLGVIIHNTDANAMYVKYGATATAAIGGYTVKIPSDGYWEMPYPIYTGALDAIWAADGSGGAAITEMA